MVKQDVVEQQIKEVTEHYGQRFLGAWQRAMASGISPFYTVHNPQVLAEMQRETGFAVSDYVRQMDHIRELAEVLVGAWASYLAVPLLYNDSRPHPEGGALAGAQIDLRKAIEKFDREVLIIKMGGLPRPHWQMTGYFKAKQLLSEAQTYAERRGWIESADYWHDVYSRS